MTGKNPDIKRQPKIGDIFYVHLDGVDSEQRGRRPCLILQNNRGNIYSPNLIVLPITSSIKRLDLPTHVFISKKDSGLACNSIVLCENPISVSKKKLGNYVTTLSNYYMQKIAEAHLIATAVIAFADPSQLEEIRKKARKLNVA